MAAEVRLAKKDDGNFRSIFEMLLCQQVIRK